MKIIQLLFLPVLIIWGGLFCPVSVGQENQVLLIVKGIKCEYQSSPQSVEREFPRLSWQIESESRNVIQSAYQIIVASSLENLNSNDGDLWDTGKVMSSQSVNIPYGGKKLQSKETCFWKVRIWDNRGYVSPFSEYGIWRMGLLSQQDWTADWISTPRVIDWKQQATRRKSVSWSDRTQTQDPAPYFRKEFQSESPVKRATIYISGVGFYEFYINGQRVGDHVFAPAFTNYNKRVLYDTYDVTAMISNGKNSCGVILGNGWYNMTNRSVWGFDKASWRNLPALRCQLEIEFANGDKKIVRSDRSWKVTHGAILYNNLFCGETYDASLDLPGWTSSSFDDSTWVNAVKVEGPQGKMVAQNCPPEKVYKTIVPVSVSEPEPGVYVFDLGLNISGCVELKVNGPSGHRVEIKCGEHLSENGLIDNSDIERFTREEKVQTDVYFLKGGGTEVWEPKFTYHGFQYVQVSGFPGIPTPDNIKGKMQTTSFEENGSFSCSNQLLNKIQNATKQSFLNNFHGYPTDCPQREKNGWTGDAHLAAEQALFNFDVTTTYTKWLNDIQDEQQVDGNFAAIIPTAGWGYFFGNGPAWDSAYPLIAWYMYLYRGDKQILADHYEYFKNYLEYLKSISNDRIVSMGLGDWAPAKTRTPLELTSTGYYYIDAAIVSKIAGLLGKNDERIKYENLADSIKSSFNKHFFNPQTGLYDEGSQTALSCALFQGLVDPKFEQLVLSKLIENVKKQQGHLDTGILGAKYLLNVLSDYNRSDVAYEIASKETFPGWGYWIKQGATTLWEQWNGTESHNHIMYGDISAWFYKSLGGINPDPEMPGFKRTIIKPSFVADLQWVKSNHHSMYGNIVSNWYREADGIKMEFTVPANTTARICLPKLTVRQANAVKSSFPEDSGFKLIRTKQNYFMFEVGSGQYSLRLSNALK